MKIKECLKETKHRVFKVGDTVRHSCDPGFTYVIESLYTCGGRKLMTIIGDDYGEYCTTYWSKVQ